MGNLVTYSILFGSAFLAASLFPAQSELLLTSLIVSEKYSVLILLAVASAGNVVGSILNYYIGRYLMHFKNHKYFPIKENMLETSKKYFKKYDSKILLMAWMPVVGDPLTVVAGAFRTNIWMFILLVSIGKTFRYMIVIGTALAII
ncbi:MAG: Inner membrane protein YqaA [Proteobacteria bacterium]|nr:MAG: Inner membrane protein YqaA [Pseudomonadota bacterium]